MHLPRILRSLTSTVAATLAAGLALSAPAGAAETISIGVTSGPHEEIMEVVRGIAAGNGLTIEIVPFSDYILPNTALADGDLDANSFQHQPYLDRQIADRGYEITSVAKNFIIPMGLYSQTLDDLSAVPEGAEVAIPNDPTNGGRALLLIEAQGLITLDKDAGLSASPLDVVENPHDLRFIEVDAAQLPHVLPDVTIAAINTNYALEAGLNPVEDSIAIEKPDSPYANVIAVQTENVDAPWVKTLVESYQTDEVRQFMIDHFEGAVVPAF